MWEDILKSWRNPDGSRKRRPGDTIPEWVKEAIAEVLSDGEPQWLDDIISAVWELKPAGTLDWPLRPKFQNYLDRHASIERIGGSRPMYKLVI